MRFSTAAIAAVSVLSGLTTAIDIINIENRHFINSKNQKPFFLKGVDYQPGGSAKVEKGGDPLSDPASCARDIYLFQKLGINTIRVYSVDPTANHDECMTMLAAAGIYLVLDVNSPLEHQHLNNKLPWTTYTPMYLEHIFGVIEVFSGYDNMLAFLAGNEVIFDDDSAEASPNYVKAVVRDMKAYITNHVHRIIPVGYSNADDLKFRTSLAHYLECGDTGYIDFFGVNSYQWCGDNTFKGSGYDKLVEDYTSYSLPVFFTEYGCNEVRPRVWEEVAALYSEDMTAVFSGGLVYEFTEEDNKYGLVKLDDDTANVMNEYDSLVTAFADAPSEPKIPSSATNPKRPVNCPVASSFENINGNLTLPITLGEKYIESGVSKKTFVKGKFLELSKVSMTTTFDINDSKSKAISDKTIKAVDDVSQSPIPAGGHGINTGGGVGTGGDKSTSSGTGDSSTEKNGAVAIAGKALGWPLALVAVGFVAFL